MTGHRVTPTALRRMIDADGGFTLRLADGRSPRRGISVCTRPAAACSFALADWDDDVVAAWMRVRHAARDRYIGGWLDERSATVWLDVVGVMHPRMGLLARVVGRFTEQHCVFDLGRRKTVALNGGAS